VFVIVQVRCWPADIVPVMFDGTGGCFAPTQSPLPIAIKPGGLIGPDSSKLNVPGSNVTRGLQYFPGM